MTPRMTPRMTEDTIEAMPPAAAPEPDPKDVIFTPAMREMQERLGSRAMIARMEERGRWSAEISPDLAGFLAARDSFYLATASADGRPYLQHRGGEEGFVKVTGPREIAFAEERGNRQYMSFGNLAENDRVALFFMDYPGRQRVKIWGRARMIEPGDPTDARIWAALRPGADRAIAIVIEAWDTNCPQHITPRYTEEEVASVTAGLRARIAEREEEIAILKARLDAR